MRGNELLEKMDLIDDKYITEADTPSGKRSWLPVMAVAACLCLIVGAFVFIDRQGTTPPVPVLSGKTTAIIEFNYKGEIPNIKADLAYLTEEEMFAMNNLLIFRGTVTELQNISVTFENQLVVRSIATIRISKVFQGEISPGDEIKVLLPCGLDFRMEDTGVIRQIRVGMEGIFMPIAYDETSYMEMYGKVLFLRDLAPCGLGDGMRWVFLMKDDGTLRFARFAYPGAKDAHTLEEIEEYILKMLK